MHPEPQIISQKDKSLIMGPATEWPAVTVQYRLNLAHALHPISPTLSALHTLRAAALHPEITPVLQPSHCPKCGTYRFSGDHPSYLMGPGTRKKRARAKSKHLKVLQRRCHLCGFSVDMQSDPSSARIQFPCSESKTGAIPVVAQINRSGKGPSPRDVSPRPAPSAPAASQPSAKRGHTRTSTLKDMLSRDRQREEGAKKRKEGHEGLAAFLKQL